MKSESRCHDDLIARSPGYREWIAEYSEWMDGDFEIDTLYGFADWLLARGVNITTCDGWTAERFWGSWNYLHG